MLSATMRLIEAVEHLNMTGEIGDGMVATLHDLAAGARLEQRPDIPGIPRFAPPGGLVSAAIRIHEREGLERKNGPQAVLVADGGRCRNCGAPR